MAKESREGCKEVTTFKVALSDGLECWEWGANGCWKVVTERHIGEHMQSVETEIYLGYLENMSESQSHFKK